MIKFAYTEHDPDFFRWTGNLFRRFVNEGVMKPAERGEEPDIIIASVWRKHPKFGKPTILITNENHNIFGGHYPLNEYFAVLGMFPPEAECNFVEYPFIAAYSFLQPLEELYDNRHIIISRPKTKFCCFAIQNDRSGDLAKKRVEFFKKLHAIKHVDSAGSVENNTGYRLPWDENFQYWISQYKFMICFENSTQKGYLSEKVFNPWLMGTIPIYAGQTELLNPEAFIHGLDEDAVEQVMKLDADDELFKRKQAADLTKERVTLAKFEKDFQEKVLNRL